MDIQRNKVELIKISDIDFPTRTIKEEDKNLFFKLKNSIKLRGQLKNIVVCQNETRYECIEGGKILKAMRELGHEDILCVNLGFIPEDKKNLVKIEISRDYFLTDYVAIGEMLKQLSEKYKVSELCGTLPFDVRQVEKMIFMTDFNWEEFEKNKMIEGQVSLFDMFDEQEEEEEQEQVEVQNVLMKHEDTLPINETQPPIEVATETKREEIFEEKTEQVIEFDIEKPKPFVFPHDLDDYKAPDIIPPRPLMTNIERKILEEEMRQKEQEAGFSFDMPKHNETDSNDQKSLF